MNPSKQFFDTNGYVVLHNVLTKEKCDSLVEYMFDLHKNNKLVKDEQCPLSDSVYGDEIFDDLLQKFTGPIGNHIGKTLIPTYTYARIYRRGEILKKHKDRPACEISATLTLGFEAKKLWNIFFDEEKEICVDLQVGEMAVYKGCEILHWRQQFKGEWHVQVFFHYVDADGPYTHHAKDGREGYGIQKDQNVGLPNLSKQQITFPKPIFNSIIIPPHNQDYPGYICVSKNQLPELRFTEEECSEILKMLEDSYPTSAFVGGTKQNSKIARSIRSAEIYMLENDHENRWIYEKISNVVSIINARHFDFEISGITHPMQLISYSADQEIKGHYDWHTDTGPGEPSTRKISLVVQLSDPKDYDGCELVINNHGTEVTATHERGSIHMFPSYMLHKVSPISRGNRYSLVVWIHGSRRFK